MQGSPRPLAAYLLRFLLAALIVLANSAPGGVTITLASSSATQGHMSGHARHADAISHAGGDHVAHSDTSAQTGPAKGTEHMVGIDNSRRADHPHGDTQADCCLSFCFPALASESTPAPVRAGIKPDNDRSVRTLVAALPLGPERPPRA